MLFFSGSVREWMHGKKTIGIAYEGYEPMALKELQVMGSQPNGQMCG
ncbi:MAG: MoaE protein [Paenibacillus sp.]|jgi:molybdopterin synthase catalytic subunit|nr:MoaE protein [Paenibacillus sp.]